MIKCPTRRSDFSGFFSAEKPFRKKLRNGFLNDFFFVLAASSAAMFEKSDYYEAGRRKM